MGQAPCPPRHCSIFAGHHRRQRHFRLLTGKLSKCAGSRLNLGPVFAGTGDEGCIGRVRLALASNRRTSAKPKSSLCHRQVSGREHLSRLQRT